MGLTDRLRSSIVALDAAPVIYFIERHPRYLPLVRPVFELFEARVIRAVTSTVTLVEVLALPLREGDEELAQSYRDILTATPSLDMLPVTPANDDRLPSLPGLEVLVLEELASRQAAGGDDEGPHG